MKTTGYLLALSLILLAATSHGAGLLDDGLDARSISLGGEAAAQDSSVIASFDANPAALSSLRGVHFELNGTASFVQGNFNRDDGTHSHLDFATAGLPAGAASVSLPTAIPITIGLGFTPTVQLEADWHYLDPSGGLGGGASYGTQEQRSRILGLRSELGAGVNLTSWLSIGLSGGALYNENELHAPYVFQSQPVLKSFKTLLDLKTDGWGQSFNFGLQLHPIPQLTFGISYRPSTIIHGEGQASGNAAAQLQSLGGAFATVDPNFRYHAEVRTKFPQTVATGVEWQASSKLRFVAGIDWINWSDAFDQLEIKLSNGSNAAINGVVGSNSLVDVAPLRWRDQFVYRTGLEYEIWQNVFARAGYTYARSTVPSGTLTPLTAAIFEHKVSAGLGYHARQYHVDLAWQWSLPTTEHVTTSELVTGEYSNSSVRVSEHLLSLTTGVEF